VKKIKPIMLKWKITELRLACLW